MAKIELKVGFTYENECGARLQIVSAPNKKNRWFEDEIGTRYHPTGEIAGTSHPEFNLIEEIGPSKAREG